MSRLLEWLTSYGAEYDSKNKILYIRKPMCVGDFVELKKVLDIYCKGKVEDIKVGL